MLLTRLQAEAEAVAKLAAAVAGGQLAALEAAVAHASQMGLDAHVHELVRWCVVCGGCVGI